MLPQQQHGYSFSNLPKTEYRNSFINMQTLNHQIKRRKERIRVTDMGNKAIPMIKSYDPEASVGDTFVRDLVDLGK